MTSMAERRSPRSANARRRSAALRKPGLGGTLLGIFIGIALGLSLAAGVAYYFTRAGSPYLAPDATSEAARNAAKEASRSARGEAGAPEKPRFDFYKILPGVEEPKIQPKAGDRGAPDRGTAERAASPDKALARADDRAAAPAPDSAPGSAGRFWLQAGSFANESEAENLKARLAFAGWEAAIQSASLPDKGLRYRVRLGPFDNADELTRMKAELAKRGFDATVIKF